MRKNFSFFLLVILFAGFLKFLQAISVSDGLDDTWFKAMLLPIATVFLSVFNSKVVGLFLSGVIVISALLLAFSLIFIKSAKIIKILKLATESLREPKKLGVSSIEHIRHAFSDSPVLERNLNAVLQGSEASFDQVMSDRLASRVQISDFDNTGISLGFYRQSPDFFVAIGLVLTFCGLVAGLHFASKGLMTADIVLARESLNKLLSASTLKFMTSIAGVGGSLLLSVAYRISLDGMERARRDLSSALDDLVEPLNMVL